MIYVRVKPQNTYEKIAEIIEQRVNDRTYSTAQKLPSEYELSEEFGVSRLTVRKAIDSLVEQNILIRDLNKGTYAMQQTKLQSGKSGLQSFSEVAEEHRLNSSSQILSFELVNDFSNAVQENLGLQLDESVYFLRRVRSFNNIPTTIENIHVKKEFIPDNITFKDDTSLFQLIEQKVKIAYSHQEVEATLATAEEAELLQIKQGAPLLLLTTITYSITGKVLLFDKSLYRADKYSVRNTLIRK